MVFTQELSMNPAQYLALPPEKVATIRELWSKGFNRPAIAAQVDCSSRSISKYVKDLPDNGTRGTQQGRPKKFSRPDPSKLLAGKCFEDMDEITIFREWPHQLPLNGARLKFAARMRDVTYGVTTYG